MNFLSKIFGKDLESEKMSKFVEIERQFAGDVGMANLVKAQWLVNRGNDHRQCNQFDEAVADFKDAIKFNPNHIFAHLSWGVVYAKKGMLKEAIDILEKATDKFTGFNDYYMHELFFALGMLYMEIDEKTKAIDYFEKSLKVYEDIKFNSAITELQKTHEKSLKGEEKEWEEREINIEMVQTAKELLREMRQDRKK